MARRRSHRSPHKSRRGRKSRGMRRARRTQNRTHSRASSRGYRRLKRRGRTHVKRGTFFKLRRKARNPGMSRTLRDGTQVTLDTSGHGAVIRVFSDYGSLISEKHVSSMQKAVRQFKKYSSGKKYAARQERDDWSMVASDNPRRRRKGRGRKSRRNPAQFPTPFSSALMNPRRGRKSRRNAPISKSDARALARVLRKHGHKRCRA